MTTSPIPAAMSDADPGSEGGWETARADLTVGGMVSSSAQFLAGVLAAGALEAVGRPERLPRYLFEGVDPAVVDEIFNLGVATGFYGGRRESQGRRFQAGELEKSRAALDGAAFHAMGGMVARSAATVSKGVAAHPADGESAREH